MAATIIADVANAAVEQSESAQKSQHEEKSADSICDLLLSLIVGEQI